jgi:uncharacterized Zn finger protein (UPF0148 family)
VHRAQTTKHSLGVKKPEEKMANNFCMNCGNKLIAGAKFCPNCGEKTNVDDDSASRNSRMNRAGKEASSER